MVNNIYIIYILIHIHLQITPLKMSNFNQFHITTPPLQIFVNFPSAYYIIEPMQSGYCKENCSVEFLSQLQVCTFEGCTAPPIRCHRCFRVEHVYEDETGKKRTHPMAKFDQSALYKNFQYLLKIYELTERKFVKQFGQVNSNKDYLVYQIFCTTEVVTKTFLSQQALAEFFILKQLSQKKPGVTTYPLSSELAPSLGAFTEKVYNTFRALIAQNTEEEQLLGYLFNQISGNSPKQLQAFLIAEQEHFAKYCQELAEKQASFNILQYIKARRQDSSRDLIYFTRFFENFLEDLYQENPQARSIFSPAEYVRYIWENLQTIAMNEEVGLYIDSWVSNYGQYEQYMDSRALEPNLLGFRMWKEHAVTGRVVTANKYFLDNFALSYIEFVIGQRQSLGSKSEATWRQFVRYLKDYVALSELKAEQYVDITKYSAYYQFRLKTQQMAQRLRNSEEISFNRNYFIEYINSVYRDNGQISMKNYKKLIALKEQQQQQKLVDFRENCDKLMAELQNLQGEKFYQVLFNNYVAQCLSDNVKPTRDDYIQFKKATLEQVDEEGLRFENDRYLLAQKQAVDSLTKTEDQPKEPNNKVQYKIDQAEDQLVALEDDEQEQDCPCCGGEPEDCNKPECQLMGYCVSCQL